MKRTILSLLAVAALCACSSSSDSAGDDDEAGGSGGAATFTKKTLTVTWSVKKADGTADACDSAYSKVRLSAQGLDSYLETSTGNPFEALFDCSAGKGTIELPTGGNADHIPCFNDCTDGDATDLGGKYRLSLAFSDPTGQLSRNKVPVMDDFIETIDMTKGDQTRDFTFYPKANFFLLTWLLWADSDPAKSTQSQISCEAGNVDTIEARYKLKHDADYNEVADGPEYVSQSPCAGSPELAYAYGRAGLSVPLPFGYYDVSITGLRNGKVVTDVEGDTDKGSRPQQTPEAEQISGDLSVLGL